MQYLIDNIPSESNFPNSYMICDLVEETLAEVILNNIAEKIKSTVASGRMSIISECISEPMFTLTQIFVQLSVIVSKESEDSGCLDRRKRAYLFIRHNNFYLRQLLWMVVKIIGEDRNQKEGCLDFQYLQTIAIVLHMSQSYLKRFNGPIQCVFYASIYSIPKFLQQSSSLCLQYPILLFITTILRKCIKLNRILFKNMPLVIVDSHERIDDCV